jgi:hypothetical protein
MIKNLFSSLFNGERKESKALHDEIIKGRDRDIRELKTVNRKIRLLLQEGQVEIVIKNVRGVIEENHKEKRK